MTLLPRYHISTVHFLCFSSFSPAPLEPGPSAGVCRLGVGLFRNILSRPLRASVR
uniref:Uncharacterized protein n=2 Tax=Sinocyclocheilus TaxID=75365 RepID=A0A671PMZ2_9TELE